MSKAKLDKKCITSYEGASTLRLKVHINFFSTRELKHYQYVEIKQFSKVEIKQNNFYRYFVNQVFRLSAPSARKLSCLYIFVHVTKFVFYLIDNHIIAYINHKDTFYCD